MTPVAINNGRLEASIAPDLGASLLWLRDRAGDDIPRPAQGAEDPRQTAGFPLLPYSNRLRSGRLVGSDRVYSLPVFEGHSFALHGTAWRSAWEVIDRSRSSVKLKLVSCANAHWPWPFEASIGYALRQDTLRIDLTYRNRADETVPVGLGYHPYLPEPADAVIRMRCDQAWTADPAGFPMKSRKICNGMVTGQPRDFEDEPYLSACAGPIVIDTPRWNRRLVIERDPALSHTIVFTPNADYFCVEPVSHGVGAMGLPWSAQGAAGVRHLLPGDTFSAHLTLSHSVQQESDALPARFAHAP